jgi:hypothetical protein
MTNKLFLHDVWVNFVQEDNFYNIPEYHEWRKEEANKIMLLDQVLLLKVNHDTFNCIAFGNNRVSDDIAEMVENSGYLRKNSERYQIRYMFVVSDGEKTLAVKLDDDQRVMEKSHLISRQYQLSIEMVADVGCHFENNYKYELSKYKNNAGLTRKEKDSYKKLDEFLQQVNESDLPMIKYLVSEIDYPTYATLRNGSLKECLDAINKIPVSTIVNQSENIDKLLGKLTRTKEVVS